MAAVEKLDQDVEKMSAAFTAQNDALMTQDGELLTGVRTIIATYRDDISYLPAGAPPVPKLRYFDVEIFQTRPGHTSEFIESRKLAKAAHEKASMPDSMVYYAVAAGAPNGTFLRFRGEQSLGAGDRFEKAHTAKGYQDAVAANQKRIDDLTSSSVVNIQHVIFQFDPKLSYMQKEFTSVDPDFWTPKPKPAAAAAPPAASGDATTKPKARK